jgi:DOMON domain-containing protein
MIQKRINIRKWIIFILFSFLLIPVSAFSAEYAHEIELKKMSFAWSVQGKMLHVKLSADTKGWVGIGFNPSARMQDANFVLGYVKDGKLEMTDAFGVRPKQHINDTSMNGKNNVTPVSGSEKGNTTTIEFIMPLDSGDEADTRIDVTGTTIVLLAFGRGKDDFRSRHRYRTALKVNLSTGRTE